MSQSTTQTEAIDPRPLLAHALDQTGQLIAGTDRADATRPTPCTEFDVDGLIGHLQGVVRRIGAVLDGRPFASVSTDMVSTDWQGDWAQGRAGTDEVLARADLDRMVSVPWGEVPARGAAASYIGELAVHSWDLAAATGQLDRLDPALAEAALPAYQAMVPADMRGGPIPFGPVVETDENASAYDKLVAWTGRDPRWSR